MLNSLFLMLAATTATPAAPANPAPVNVTEPNPKAMSQQEIRDHNATLPRTHPYYIRCVKSADTGSLVKRRASCRTNEQWNLADAAGNREARDVADHMRGKAVNSN